jgi:hypothetical protein
VNRKKYMNWLPWDGSLPGESLERCTWAWALIWHHEDLPLTLLRHHKDRWPPPWSFATRITFINSAITPQQARSASAWQHKETTSTLFISLLHAHIRTGHDVSTIQKIAVPQTFMQLLTTTQSKSSSEIIKYMTEIQASWKTEFRLPETHRMAYSVWQRKNTSGMAPHRG